MIARRRSLFRLSTTTTSPTSGGWIAIATLLRPQGRRGELLAEPLTDLSEVFARGRTVHLAGATLEPAAGEAARTLEDCWTPTGRNAGRLVMKLSGCESINDAEALAGRRVLIPSDEMPKLDADTFFVSDLVGCAFFDGEKQLGTIVDLEFPVGSDGRRLEDAAQLLAVEIPGEDEPVLVPFIRAWLDSVDLTARRVTMHLPEGLIGGEEIAGEDDDEDAEYDDAV
jgi:16S rRNA processing protein RimM